MPLYESETENCFENCKCICGRAHHATTKMSLSCYFSWKCEMKLATINEMMAALIIMSNDYFSKLWSPVVTTSSHHISTSVWILPSWLIYLPVMNMQILHFLYFVLACFAHRPVCESEKLQTSRRCFIPRTRWLNTEDFPITTLVCSLCAGFTANWLIDLPQMKT